MSSNQTLTALDIVRREFVLPEYVIELQKENEFHKRLNDALRNDQYLNDVLSYFKIMRQRGCEVGIDMHDHDVASQYGINDIDNDDSDNDDIDVIQWQDLRAEDISRMTLAEKWMVVPFLRALGFWVTIYYDIESRTCLPFCVADEKNPTEPSVSMRDHCTELAPLAKGDYDLTPPTVPVRV